MFHAPSSEAKQQSDNTRTQSPRADFSAPVPVAPGSVPLRGQLARLHSTYGNQAVLRMLSKAAPAIQTKLAVNKPGDEFEQEADRVADHVMRMTAPPPHHAQHLNRRALGTPAPAPSIQRKCSGCEEEEKVQRKCVECEEEDKKTGLQRKKTGAGPQFAPPSVHSVLSSLGQALDPATRAFMEPRFGHDFSRVRVHTDAGAADSAKAVNALAYTSGQHVVFGSAEYKPQSDAGRRLLAHELAHVVQQSTDGAPAASLQRAPIDNCTQSEEYDIEVAIGRAYSDLAVILPLVTLRPVPDNVKNALYLAFRDDSVATADLVRNNIVKLMSQINGTHFVCADSTSDTTCSDSQIPAYSPGVVICRPQFFAGGNRLLQSEALIHEAAHTYLSMEDRGYFAKSPNLCSESRQPSGHYDPKSKNPGTAGLGPGLRLENADSYGCFVYYLRYAKPADLQETSAGYKGDNLKIEMSDDTLYTEPQTPPNHRYWLSGVPENSGFLYSWGLQAGAAFYKLAVMGDKTAIAENMSEDHQAVYVPVETGRLLKRDKVARVTLVCQIQIFASDDSGRPFPAPIITKSVEFPVVFGPPPIDL